MGLTWLSGICLSEACCKYCCIQRKQYSTCMPIRLIPSTYMHSHTNMLSLSFSLLQCFFYSVSPVGMDTYAHHNNHSCIDNAWKQALIKFSLHVLCTQFGRYQYVLSEGLSYINMEVNWHCRYLMCVHSLHGCQHWFTHSQVVGCVSSRVLFFCYLK